MKRTGTPNALPPLPAAACPDININILYKKQTNNLGTNLPTLVALLTAMEDGKLRN